MPKQTPSELGRVVRSRRTSLSLTQVQVVDRANSRIGAQAISEPTLRAVETGRTSASDLTLAALSQALDWPPDHLRKIRDGEGGPDPVSATLDPELIQLAARAGKLTPENRAKLEGYAERLFDEQE